MSMGMIPKWNEYVYSPFTSILSMPFFTLLLAWWNFQCQTIISSKETWFRNEFPTEVPPSPRMLIIFPSCLDISTFLFYRKEFRTKVFWISISLLWRHCSCFSLVSIEDVRLLLDLYNNDQPPPPRHCQPLQQHQAQVQQTTCKYGWKSKEDNFNFHWVLYTSSFLLVYS